MILTIIIPSKQWIESAGVRIRYKRLRPCFEAAGVDLRIIPLEQVTNSCIESSNLVIISKIFELDSIKIISVCQNSGIRVGIDLFDDYFSDPKLSIFSKQHDWLRLAAKMCDFAICSTEKMKLVAGQFFDIKYVHQINDTKDPCITHDETRRLINRKLESFNRSGTLKILWFGIGDNPCFDVGIKDLNSYSNFLFQIAKRCSPVTFTILTNERALTPENLTSISYLPMKASIEIWSEKSEEMLLRESDIAFMPVSHQNFSTAKSTNRCLTALTYGCQVLSNGFNLYSDFSKLIYDSTEDLINDCKSCKFRLNKDSAVVFEKICKESFDCEVEVSKLLKFLHSNILSTKTTKQIRLTIVNFKPESSKLTDAFTESRLIQIDGERFAEVGRSNFWVGTVNDQPYFTTTKKAYQLLTKKWRSHFKGIKDDTGNFRYRLRARDLQKLMPEHTQNVKDILNYRCSKSNSDKVLNQFRRRVLYSFVDHSIGSVIKTLFDCEYIYLANNVNQVRGLRRL
jgi:hypothetical protein